MPRSNTCGLDAENALYRGEVAEARLWLLQKTYMCEHCSTLVRRPEYIPSSYYYYSYPAAAAAPSVINPNHCGIGHTGITKLLLHTVRTSKLAERAKTHESCSRVELRGGFQNLDMNTNMQEGKPRDRRALPAAAACSCSSSSSSYDHAAAGILCSLALALTMAATTNVRQLFRPCLPSAAAAAGVNHPHHHNGRQDMRPMQNDNASYYCSSSSSPILCTCPNEVSVRCRHTMGAWPNKE